MAWLPARLPTNSGEPGQDWRLPPGRPWDTVAMTLAAQTRLSPQTAVGSPAPTLAAPRTGRASRPLDSGRRRRGHPGRIWLWVAGGVALMEGGSSGFTPGTCSLDVTNGALRGAPKPCTHAAQLHTRAPASEHSLC